MGIMKNMKNPTQTLEELYRGWCRANRHLEAAEKIGSGMDLEEARKKAFAAKRRLDIARDVMDGVSK